MEESNVKVIYLAHNQIIDIYNLLNDYRCMRIEKDGVIEQASKILRQQVALEDIEFRILSNSIDSLLVKSINEDWKRMLSEKPEDSVRVDPVKAGYISATVAIVMIILYAGISFYYYLTGTLLFLILKKFFFVLSIIVTVVGFIFYLSDGLKLDESDYDIWDQQE